jgi:drug/metabolite transporter (DMT)-like permease
MVLVNYLLVCLIFGTTFLAIKLGIEAGAPPLCSAGIRFLVAGLIVITFYAAKNRDILRFLRHKKAIGVGLCSTFVSFAGLYWSEQYIPSGLSAVISALSPMMVFLVQSLNDGKKPSWWQLMGLLSGALGVWLISLPGMTGGVSIRWSAGIAAAAAGSLFYGIGAVISRRFFDEAPACPPFLLNGIQMFYGGAMLLAASFLLESPDWSTVLNPSVSWSILYLMLAGSIGGHGLYFWLVHRTNPVFPSTWVYISPIVALLVGSALLGEHIAPAVAAGTVLVLCGVFMVNREVLLHYFQSRKKQTKSKAVDRSA